MIDPGKTRSCATKIVARHFLIDPMDRLLDQARFPTGRQSVSRLGEVRATTVTRGWRAVRGLDAAGGRTVKHQTEIDGLRGIAVLLQTDRSHLTGAGSIRPASAFDPVLRTMTSRGAVRSTGAIDELYSKPDVSGRKQDLSGLRNLYEHHALRNTVARSTIHHHDDARQDT